MYRDDSIAIVGIGCRFPGADSVDAFWDLLREGRDAIGEIPENRFNLSRYLARSGVAPGQVISKWGGYLKDIDMFDAGFFGISPREAATMDPQQRLLLEVAWEAIEDGGLVADELRSRHVGVFVAMWAHDFEARVFERPTNIDLYCTTGSGRYAASGRISYALDLRGPSVTLDAGCASSHVGVHLAIQSLRSGECDVAMAGASNMILQPHISIAYSQAGMLAPDGRCKFGDARANGYVRSEGTAVVVLKRLADAIADRDPIRAVILGSAVNHAGQSSGSLVLPSKTGQADLIRSALQEAGVEPGEVQYVEAHGTGTSAGDPIEIGALGLALGESRDRNNPLRIGSVKTNIGHTEAAAGLAGLLKTTLALQNRELPPSLHFQAPSPKVPWDQLPIEVQSKLSEWPDPSRPLVAGVSSFGITGTIAHLVLQEPPQVVEEVESAKPGPLVLPLSAHTPDALKARAEQFVDRLPHVESAESAGSPTDVCYTAGARRSHHEFRLAVVGHTAEDLRESLRAFVADDSAPRMVQGRAQPQHERKTVFVFPGQGAQWIGMGRRLMQTYPEFASALDRCGDALRPFVDWDLHEELMADGDRSRLDEIDVIQPVLFAIQVALARLWRSWGIEPQAVVGHSMGEVAAAHVAGALTLEDAARVIATRSRLMRRTSGNGAMAVVELSFDQARAEIQEFEDRLSVAVSNGPRSSVISGEVEALEEVLVRIEARGLFCRRVKVDVASHSPQMEPLVRELADLLSEIAPRESTVPIYSTVDPGPLSGDSFDPVYWGRNLRQPVRFGDAVRRLLESGYDTFIELSPHPILLQPIREVAREVSEEAVDSLLAVPSFHRDEDEVLDTLTSLGSLYVSGHRVNWSALYPNNARTVSLPSYPWRRERFWYEDGRSDGRRHLAGQNERGHPILGARFESALHADTHFWEFEVDTTRIPYVADHVVRGVAILPGAAMVEFALSAVAEVLGNDAVALEDVRLEEALPVGKDKVRVVQLVLSSTSRDRFAFQIFSREGSAADSDASWIRHVSGIAYASPRIDWTDEHRTPGATDVDHAFYARLLDRGLQYGPQLQAVRSISGGTAPVAEVRLPSTVVDDPGYVVHPVLLDAAFQVVVDALDRSIDGTFVPVGIQRLTAGVGLEAGTQNVYFVRLKDLSTLDDGEVSGDLSLADASGNVVLEVMGLRLQRLRDDGTVSSSVATYEVQWTERPLDSGSRSEDHARERWTMIGAANDPLVESLAKRLRESGVHSCRTLAFSDLDEKPGAASGVALISNGESIGDGESVNVGSERVVCVLPHRGDADEPTIDDDARDNVARIVSLVQRLLGEGASSLRLGIVTRGVQRVSGDAHLPDLEHGAAWGLIRTIRNEQPQLACTGIDLSVQPGPEEIEALVRELSGDSTEDQVVVRGARRFVSRLVLAPLQGEPRLHEREADTDEAYVLSQPKPGLLDQMVFEVQRRRAPGPGEIELRVNAASLNFVDVLKALGTCPGYDPTVPPALGAECCGEVVAVGPGVEGVSVGDAVVALSPSLDRVSALSRYLTVPVELVATRPAVLSEVEGASIPIAFLTAWYGLYTLANLRKGERVLIHAASGGVGLAAIQLAQRVGAEIFATAGSEEKREFVRQQGVEHVFDSRSTAFFDEIQAVTNGQGVDVVLNSLTGEALKRSIDLLTSYGRFIEIGKRDIYDNSQLGMRSFRSNRLFAAVDLAPMTEDCPAVLGRLLREVLDCFEQGSLKPLPLSTFDTRDVQDAFRTMAQARHIGKIVVRMDGDGVRVRERVRTLHSEATYLITGGLGALGLEVARALVSEGARNLVLWGRSAPSNEARSVLDELASDGVRVDVQSVDVARRADVEAALDAVRRTMPPLRGVVHAAGILDDATLANLTRASLDRALAPKISGAWNLHLATADDPVDFFVLFSSVASVLGLAGQANYVAGNAFLDALAHHRSARGLPATSINWGPWASIGLAAARSDRGDRLASSGLPGIGVEDGIAAFKACLAEKKVQRVVARLDVPKWVGTRPPGFNVAFFGEFESDGTAASGQDSVEIKDRLVAAEPGRERKSILQHYLCEQIGLVLRLPPSRVHVDKPLKAQGLDSLMTLELRNRLDAGLGLKLPSTLTWNYPTVTALVPYLAELLRIPLDERSEESNADDAEDTAALAEVSQLTEDEAEALLAQKLASLDAGI